MDKVIKYALGAAALIVGLGLFNLFFDKGEIAWVSNVGITILIVTAWVMTDRYTKRKEDEAIEKFKKNKNRKHK